MRLSMLDQTMPVMLQEAMARNAARPAVRYYRDGRWQSHNWQTVSKRLKYLAAGLMELKLEAGQGMAILGANAPEWLLSDMALASLGVISVPLYPTLDTTTIEQIIRDSGVRGIILIGESAVAKYRDYLQAHGKRPQNWITVVADSQQSESGWHHFENLIQRGESLADHKAFFVRLESCQRSQPLTYIYTSGTTGEPKGVVLTHGNLLSNLAASIQLFKLDEGQEVYLSILPLSHAYERHCHYVFVAYGAEIVYGRGLEQLPEDLVTVSPTIFVAVPRLFEKFYAKFNATMQSRAAISRAFARWAIRKGSKVASQQFAMGIGLADKLVLQKIRRRFGKRLKFAVSGGGSLHPQIAEFFRAAGVCLVEGYGMTEASPIISCNDPMKPRIGTVGKIYPNLESRIADTGELWVRGPSIAIGYHQQPKASSNTFDAQGWLHTGDLVSLDSDGYLSITGRLKEIIKTSGGKIIAPLKLEERLRNYAWCDQVCVVGEGRPYVVALVVTTWTELNSAALEKIQRDLHSCNQGLANFETIKAIALLTVPFSEAKGTLTPTQKIRRQSIYKSYKNLIESLYQVDAATQNTDAWSPFEGKISGEAITAHCLKLAKLDAAAAA